MKKEIHTRLLFVVNKLSIGGAEKHTLGLINGLSKRGFECSIALLKPNFDLLPEIEEGSAHRVVSLDVKSRLDRSACNRLGQFIDDHHIDTVVCVDMYPMLYAYMASKASSRNCQLVEVLHLTTLANNYERAKMFAYRFFFKRFCRTVFVSENQKMYWLAKQQLRVQQATTILNGIDVDYFSDLNLDNRGLQVRAELGMTNSPLVIGMCAALRPHKGHLDVIDSLAKLHARGLSAHLLIVGDGAERENIQAKARKQGLDSFVKLVGAQSDVRPYVLACDCMVVASTAVETFSLSILESMAMAKPVVSSRIGGADEQIDHGVTGLLFEKKDLDALVGQLLALTDKVYREQLGRRAQYKVRSQFTIQKMLGRYAQLLRRNEGLDHG